MTTPKFQTFRELMTTKFPENDQVRRIKRPDAIRLSIDDFQCDIHISDLQTEADLLSWLYWLCGKQVISVEILSRVMELTAEARGFNLHGDLAEQPTPTPMDQWFMDHQEINSSDLAALEGTTRRRAREKLSKLVKKRELKVSRNQGALKFYAKRGEFRPVKRILNTPA
jgi:hypothetical protein